MTPKIVVVVGATGAQGSSVVKSFSNDATWKVRAITRDVNSEKAKALQAQGIETVAADLDDPNSLDAAFKEANVIFGVTDFWGIYAANQGKAKPGQAMNEWTYEHEVQQGKNLFDAASKVGSLERFVFSSLSNASKWSKGKYKGVLHFDSKAMAEQYGKVTYPDLWKKTSTIQAGFYLENFAGHPWMSPTKGENGVYQFTGTIPGPALMPLVAATEDMGPLTKALVDLPAGKNLIAYREYITFDQFIQLWSKVLGLQAERGLPSTLPGLPDEIREELAQGVAYMVEFGFEGRDDPTVVHPKDLGIALNLGSVEEWIKKQNWSL